jgi:hypothetical protein
MYKVIFFIAIYICIINTGIKAQEVPVEIKQVIDTLQHYDHILIGIGTAEAETDGEAILLAQDRAREEIAHQITSMVHMSVTDHAPVNGIENREMITEINSNIHLSGSYVEKLARTKDGTWWCIVLFPKNRSITPRVLSTIDLVEFINDYSFDLTKVRTVSSIPDWVFNPTKNMPEYLIYCIGAARERNDGASIQLAIERAHKSIVHSLDCEVTSSIRYFEYTLNFFNREENKLSIISKYDYVYFNTFIINATKTRDGTWWILLGCPVSSVYIGR